MKRQFMRLVMTAIMVTAGLGGSRLGAASAAHTRTSSSNRAALASYTHLPLSFELNRGQGSRNVKFVAHAGQVQLALAPNGVFLTTPTASRVSSPRLGSLTGSIDGARTDSPSVALHFAGARLHPRVTGLSRLPGKVNYFEGNNPRLWHTDIPTFARVEYHDLYPGIDLLFRGSAARTGGSRLEYDWVLQPRANPHTIHMALQSLPGWKLNAAGSLVLHDGKTELVQGKPVAYQIVGGRKRVVASRYVLQRNGRFGFALGRYDANKALVIDPTLVYSTYLAGTGDDVPQAIAVDASGSAYVTGWTESLDFPTSHPLQGSLGGACGGAAETPCKDAFVTKLNSSGTGIVYSTYLGGSDDDAGNGIAVDSAGNAYIVGSTASADFPTHAALQSAYGGGSLFGDAFAVKLAPAGDSLAYSTYLGGSDEEEANGVAVDSLGSAYVTGYTRSSNFPLHNAAQTTFDPGTCTEGSGAAERNVPCSDAFVAKLTPSGNSLVYSTYLGGSNTDVAQAIAVDAAGSAYVTGWTATADGFPTTSRVPQRAYGGGNLDAFVTKLSPPGNQWVYSMYLGGGTYDVGEGIAVDTTGNAYVSGNTTSEDFPTTAAVFQRDFIRGQDAFVTKVNSTGSALSYSTFLGGSGDDDAATIAVDGRGDAYVTGSTSSDDFPTVGSLQPYQGTSEAPSDAIVAALNPTGSTLLFSTYLGGTESDQGNAIATDGSGSVYVAGQTDSNDFPTAQPEQAAPVDGVDGFIAKIFNPLPPAPSPTATSTPKPKSTATPVPHKKKTVKCKKGYKLVHGKCKRVKKHR